MPSLSCLLYNPIEAGPSIICVKLCHCVPVLVAYGVADGLISDKSFAREKAPLGWSAVDLLQT